MITSARKLLARALYASGWRLRRWGRRLDPTPQPLAFRDFLAQAIAHSQELRPPPYARGGRIEPRSAHPDVGLFKLSEGRWQRPPGDKIPGRDA